MAYPHTNIFITLFPIPWNDDLTIPIHEKGNRIDTDNHHIIVMSSYYAKQLTLFIGNYIDSTKQMVYNQVGLKTYYKTEDNILLHVIYESYFTNKNKKVDIAFTYSSTLEVAIKKVYGVRVQVIRYIRFNLSYDHKYA